jgi:DNA-directed RNA polymerase specialized sigma24 family protein
LEYYEAIGDLHPGDFRAEDIVDLTYLEAQRRGEDPPGYRRLRTVADRVLQRHVDRIRAQRRAAERNGEVAFARRMPELLPDPTTSPPDDLAAAAELRRAVARLVGELPDDEREPLLMVVVDGQRVDDVAALEQLTRGEVLRRIADGMIRLRRLLAREYGEGEPPDAAEILNLLELPIPTAPQPSA